MLAKKDKVCYNNKVNGPVAQLGERRVRNAEVMGSNPTISTITAKLHFLQFCGYFYLIFK